MFKSIGFWKGKKRKASGEDGSGEEEEAKKRRKAYVISDEWMDLIKKDIRFKISKLT